MRHKRNSRREEALTTTHGSPGRPRRAASPKHIGATQPPPETAREAALRTLCRVEAERAFAGEALERELAAGRLDKRERALATELTFGTLRARGRVDHALAAFLKRPLAELTPWIRNVLRLGAYQLLYLDRVPASAAVDESVKLARRYGHAGTAGLVNAVLRNLVRQGPPPVPDPASAADFDARVAALAIAYSHPRWLVAEWLARFGPAETEALLRANNQPAPVAIRANGLKTSPAALGQRLAAEGVTVAPLRYLDDGFVISDFDALTALPSYRDGLFIVQDEAAMLVAHVVDPRPGERVIDACAAPGGKTTHLAGLMGDRGEILAADVEPARLRLVVENCARLGVTCVETVAVDARRLGRLKTGWADRALVDAPCSGLGTLRRRPDARWRKEASAAGELAPLQVEILAGVAPCVKPGGTLVYSTCTLGETENQDVVRAFLLDHPEYAPEDLAPWVPAGLREAIGADGWWLQTYPHRHGIDGFFVARLRRRR